MYWPSKIAQSLFTATGGLIWVAAGIVITLRPGANPPATFRDTAGIMPLLAGGLFLIGVSLGTFLYTHGSSRGKLFKTAVLLFGIGSVSYGLGSLIRNLFLAGVGWEPLMPLGYLAAGVGLLLLGVASLTNKVFPKPTALLILFSGIFLLLFNDQFLPATAVPFGIGITVLAAVPLKATPEKK